MLDVYILLVVISSYWIVLFIIIYCLSLSIVTVFVLKSTFFNLLLGAFLFRCLALFPCPSFWIILSFNFCAFCSLEMFPNLREVALYSRYLWGPVAYTLLVTRAIYSSCAFHLGYMGLSVVAGPTTVEVLVGGAGPWPGWLPGPT